MFKLPKSFNPKARLDKVVIDGEEAYVVIGGKKYTDFVVEDSTVSLTDTTYKHYRFYTSGAVIDTIQTLAHHKKATYDFDLDEDGDVYWTVAFRIQDFRKIIRRK